MMSGNRHNILGAIETVLIETMDILSDIPEQWAVDAYAAIERAWFEIADNTTKTVYVMNKEYATEVLLLFMNALDNEES